VDIVVLVDSLESRGSVDGRAGQVLREPADSRVRADSQEHQDNQGFLDRVEPQVSRVSQGSVDGVAGADSKGRVELQGSREPQVSQGHLDNRVGAGGRDSKGRADSVVRAVHLVSQDSVGGRAGLAGRA